MSKYPIEILNVLLWVCGLLKQNKSQIGTTEIEILSI